MEEVENSSQDEYSVYAEIDKIKRNNKGSYRQVHFADDPKNQEIRTPHQLIPLFPLRKKRGRPFKYPENDPYYGLR